MAGLNSILNIGKTALLTHQLNLQTTGHNTANVNTDGYSRQHVQLIPNFPVPSSVGPIGNGVNANIIYRDYDRFITKTLFDKTSVMKGLETRQSGMKLIEGVLNEVETNGLNELINQFWNGWDDVANNAEGIPERTTLLSRANLLVQGFKDRYDQLLKLSQDVDLNIRSSVDDINKLADQIAELNVQILSSEVGDQKANDLRDQRDELLKRLSGLTNVHYFETQRGTYTVIIGQNRPLVEGDKSWHLEVRSGEVYWLSANNDAFPLTTEDVSEGELGGWLDIKQRIAPRDLTKLISSIANATSGKAIKGSTIWDSAAIPHSTAQSGSTRWDAIDGVTVTGDFSIDWSGTDQNGNAVTGTFNYTAGPPESNATVADFLASIENAFYTASGRTDGVQVVKAYINDEGRLVIEDLEPGDFPISFQIDSISGGITGLDLGKFDGSYPPNYLEELNRIAREFIKEVNRQHSQGIGLKPLSETTGVYTAINTDEPIGAKSSGLEFAGDVEDGAFEIWLYDENGNVIDANPVTPEVNEPVTISVLAKSTSMEDLQQAIDAIDGLTARIINERLVIQADGQLNGTTPVAGFAFGKDTSGALMALGLNSFFKGSGASDMEINGVLQNDLELIAAAQVEPRGSDKTSSGIPVADEGRPLGLPFFQGKFYIWIYDEDGMIVDQDPDTVGSDPVEIQVDPNYTTVNDIVDAINDIDGLHAQVVDGKLRVEVLNEKWQGVAFGGDSSGALRYLGIDPGQFISHASSAFVSYNSVDDPTVALASAASGLDGWGYLRTGFSFTVNSYDSDNNLTNTATITLNAGDSLTDLANNLNALSFVNASVAGNRLVIQAANPGEVLSFDDDQANVLGVLGITKDDSMWASYGVESRQSVTDPTVPLGSALSGLEGYGFLESGSFSVAVFDDGGMNLSTTEITFDPTTDSLEDIRNAIDAISGINASITTNSIGGVLYYRLAITPVEPNNTVVFTADSTEVIDQLGLGKISADVRGAYKVDRADTPFVNFENQVQDGSFNVYMYDEDGYLLAGELTGSKANTTGGAPITAATQWQSIDGVSITGNFDIRFSGKDYQGNLITGTYTGTGTDTVQDLLNAIEAAFPANPSPPPATSVSATVDANGRIVVTSNVSGESIAFRIDEVRPTDPAAGDAISGLSFGEFTGAYSIEVEPYYDGLKDIALRVDALPDLKAWVQDGRMEVQVEGRAARFVLADDTSGVLEAVDLFTPKGGLHAPANNLNALAMRDVSRLSIEDLDDSTLTEAYTSLVGTVGIDSRSVQLDYDFSRALVTEMEARRDSVSGVSLDEEMANLIKFQHSYAAAAKLMKVADELFVTLLQTKQ